MTISLIPDVRGTMSLKDFVRFVDTNVDLDSHDSLICAAEALAALSNDKDLLPVFLSKAIDEYLSGKVLPSYNAQSILLARGEGFYVRANIWSPLKLQSALRTHEERIFSYRSMHDHNFSFLTIGHFGSGYTTRLYTYDARKVAGRIGELVDLSKEGEAKLHVGKVMAYREKYDVHTQLPPEELSISINLMVEKSRSVEPDQYVFDEQSGRITGLPEIAIVHRRASIVRLAASLGGRNAAATIEKLLRTSPCRRVREAAAQSISCMQGLSSSDFQTLLTLALNDSDPLVRDAGASTLQFS